MKARSIDRLAKSLAMSLTEKYAKKLIILLTTEYNMTEKEARQFLCDYLKNPLSSKPSIC